MDTKELTRDIEYADRLAMQLSAHCALFDGYYDDTHGIEQAALDPEVFFANWNMIYEKVDELYGFVKVIVEKTHGEECGNCIEL